MASAGDEADTGEASDDAAFEMELFRVPICAAPEQHAQIVSRTAGRTGFRTRPGSSAHGFSQPPAAPLPGGCSSPGSPGAPFSLDLLRTTQPVDARAGHAPPGSPLALDLFKVTPAGPAGSTPSADATSPANRHARVAGSPRFKSPCDPLERQLELQDLERLQSSPRLDLLRLAEEEGADGAMRSAAVANELVIMGALEDEDAQDAQDLLCTRPRFDSLVRGNECYFTRVGPSGPGGIIMFRVAGRCSNDALVVQYQGSSGSPIECDSDGWLVTRDSDGSRQPLTTSIFRREFDSLQDLHLLAHSVTRGQKGAPASTCQLLCDTLPSSDTAKSSTDSSDSDMPPLESPSEYSSE